MNGFDVIANSTTFKESKDTFTIILLITIRKKEYIRGGEEKERVENESF